MDECDHGRRQLRSRILLVFAAFAFLDVLYWVTAPFESFMPPSDGPWKERVYFAAVTAMGPVALRFMGFEWARTDGLIALGLIVVAVGFALRWPQVAALRYVAYAAIVVWWFLGFGVAAIRIT
jgi:hypothetical protein